jgi:hypothetical protein
MHEKLLVHIWRARAKYPNSIYPIADKIFGDWVDPHKLRDIEVRNQEAFGAGLNIYRSLERVHGFTQCTSYDYRVAGSLVEMFLLCAYCAPTPQIEAFLARYRLMIDNHWHAITVDSFLDWIAKATKNTKEGTLYSYMLTLYDTEPELRYAMKSELDLFGEPK